MKRNNKKGFTLIELLAVIVILAILATAAFTLVIPAINRARANTFATEAANMVEVAERYFATHSSSNCVSINKLVSDGEIKGDVNKYFGFVYVENKNTNPTYYIAFTNGSFYTPNWKKANANTAVPEPGKAYNGVNSYIAIPLSSVRDADGNANTSTTYTGEIKMVNSGANADTQFKVTSGTWCDYQ